MAIIAWVFIVVGGGALLYHVREVRFSPAVNYDAVWVCLLRLLALLGGVFLLRGRNWARWLLALWMAFHVGLSVLHSTRELMMHLLLFGLIGYFLFRPVANAYFRRPSAVTAPASNPVDPASI